MPSLHESQSLFFTGPAGRLEAILWRPVRADSPLLAAVICHPHPLFGGTMHNKVVYNAAKTMDALGIPVLRFNFRGAGLSAGEHDNGRGERRDVQAALDFLAAQFPGTSLLLAGFSFGSVVGLWVGCRDARVSELIGIGIPVNSSDFSFLADCPKPKLFVHGAEDKFGARKKVEEVVAALPGENKVVVVENADHFFAGHLDKFNATISAWLTERHPVPRLG
jgi:alpha/beta superfamily hydrolase